MVIRALDNPYLNDLVNRYRTLAGNRILEKRDFLRGILEALKKNEAVGILMDQNSSLQEGVFVPFFGVPACTATGLAKIALRADAAVVPAFAFWDASQGRYWLRFDPRWNWCAQQTRSRTWWPTPSCSRVFWSSTSAAIRTSGCGFTGAGKPGRPASRRCMSEAL